MNSSVSDAVLDALKTAIRTTVNASIRSAIDAVLDSSESQINMEAINAVLKVVAEVSDRYWFSIQDFSRAWGFERSYFYTHRHLLPHFGAFDDPVHKKFSRESFLAWVVVPLSEHAKRWTDLSSDERREIERIRKKSS
ncbi:MAG: hypothetical protein WC784_04980 [Candidatus Shapirobacteria bacterium]|jgi:hypothetical protein